MEISVLTDLVVIAKSEELEDRMPAAALFENVDLVLFRFGRCEPI